MGMEEEKKKQTKNDNKNVLENHNESILNC